MNRARLRAVAAFAFAFCAASLFAIDYTWTGEGDDALWTNPANWGQTTKYPGSGDRATFPENCTAEVEIGSVNNYQAVSMLKVCAGASVRIYAHDPTAETRLDLKSAWELNYAGNAVEFDHVRVDGGKDLTLGSASTLTLENGSDLRVGAFNVKAAASVSVLSGSVVSSGNIDADSSVSTSITVDNSTWTTGTNNDFTFKNTATLSLLNGASLSINQFIANGAGTLLTIDDSTFIVRHCVQLGTSAPGGGHVVFKGANAVMRCTDEAYNNASFKPWSNSATMTSHFDFDFEVPEGGFADVPLQWSGQKAAFAEVGNVPADYIRFNVLSTSPALCAGTKTDCVLFYSSVKGITRSKVTNGDAETATLSFSDESGEAEAASDAEAVALWATVGSGAAANATPGVGSLTPRRTTAVNRNVITVDGAVSAVASGDCTTQVELWCGTANDAAAMERYAVVVPARGPARFSVVYSAPENVGEVTHYFQWRLFDIGAGDVTNKTAVSAVFSAATKDATTYTWKDADGDWSGDWNDPAHWTSDYASATGYPASGNATAVFPRNHAITVTITDNFTVGTVDLSDYDAVEGETIDVTFKGAEGEGGGTNKALTVSTLFNISGPLGTVTLDNAAVKANAGDLKPGPNGTFRLVNGAYFYAAGGWETASVGNWPTTLELHGKSVMSIGDVFTRNDKKIIIDDSRLVFRSQVQLSRLGVGGDIVFMGANPVAYFDSTTSNCFMPSSAPENNFIFYVPAGGFDAPPIQCKSTNTRGLFVNTKTSGYIAFIVPDDSPCYSTVGTFDAPLIAWTSTVEITTNRFDYGALPDGGYFMLGTSAAEDYGFVEQSSFSGTAKSLGVHIVSAAHPNRVVVSADSDAAAAAVTGFDPALGTFDTYSSGDVVTFAAPAATTAGGVRYKVAGYTLNTYADGLMTAVESTEEGAGNSVQVTLPGKPVEVVWHFAADYPVTATAVNDAGAAVALSGDGHTASSSPVTLTASTATEGMEFQYWYGDVPYANRYDNPLVVAADKAASVYAFFGATPDNGGVRYATANISGGNYKNFFDTATWTGGIIPGTNDTAVLVATRGDTYSASNKSKFYVPSFFAVHDLIVSNACLYVAVTPTEWNNPNFQFDQNGYPFYNIGSSADAYRTEPVGFDVAGDVILRPYYTTQQNQNGSIFVGGSQQRCFTKVNIGGDLVLEDGAFQISAGHPFDYTLDPAKAIDGPNGFIAFPHEEELFRGGNRLKVGGEVTLAASAGLATNFIHVANDFRTGAAVWLDLKDVTVGEGAAITAWRGGYGKFDGKGVADGRSYSMCPGGHSTGDNTSGGSYGGLGGSETQNPGYQKPTAHVAVYGYEYFPINPGSPNGGNAGIESRGGGSIRLDCATLNLDGGLVANGHNAGGNKGGSSGGGILVVCGAFNPGAN
ncbi:MAG: hypothetical protein IJ829_06855, partial [Kiritimatiellae bacterium]|nr:hypothetical protein [Kiritimatiellia bacterium]